MHILILLLNLLNLLALSGSAALGVVTGELGRRFDPDTLHRLMLWHTGAGFLSGLFTLFVHCIVFTYFIGTGLAIKEAVRNHRLDPELIRPTRKFKARTFPFAFFAMVFTLAGVVVGGGVASPSHWIPTWVHVLLVAAGLVMNVVAVPFEVRACRDNTALIGTIEGLIEAKAGTGDGGAASPVSS